MKVVSVINQKGWVGKMTSAINITHSMAILGKKTLLVDIDPQGNASRRTNVLKEGVNTSNSNYELIYKE
ncbi:AAA family ATPase [Borrelia sp. P9F1]|nr:AAA family ATPase [Borrelia sp. P9F1]WKC57987.1 AAA family ATPase [Borrelia sp. P9F1]